jgi:hypothetical protein
VTVCPIRLLDPEAAGFVEWFLAVRESSPMTGAVVGVKEWPSPGGIREQLAAHVEAVELLSAELNALFLAEKTKPKTETDPTPDTEPEPDASA